MDTLRQALFRIVLDALKDGEVDDPNVDLFLGVLDGDVAAVQAALTAGANVNGTDGELIERHLQDLARPAVAQRLALRILSAMRSSVVEQPDILGGPDRRG